MMSAVSLAEAATRKAGALWVSFDGYAPRLVWHLWHDGAVWFVCDGLEQSLPGAAHAVTATVTVGRKDVVSWHGAVSRVTHGQPAWGEVVPLLHDRRLNPPDGEDQPLRWARESLLVRITPT